MVFFTAKIVRFLIVIEVGGGNPCAGLRDWFEEADGVAVVWFRKK